MTSAVALTDKRKLLLEKLLRKQGVATGGQAAIPRRDGSGPAPLSFGQQRLWFLHQLEPAGTAYNLSEAVRLRGALDAPALAQALAEMTRRHEVLRTVYVTFDGEPRQVVQPPSSVPLPLVRLAGAPEDRREDEARRISAQLAAAPFDLAGGPLLRAAVIELDRDDNVLLLVAHHIAADGWSMQILVRELTQLYGAFAVGAPLQLPELPLQYSDFAAWQRGWLQGETLESQLRFWREQLAGAPTQLALPVDHPWPAVQTSRGAGVEVALDAGTTAALRTLARELGATLFMVLVGGFAALLQRVTGQDDLLLGTPSAGRGRPEIAGLIGFFINTLVLRADLTGDPDISALVSRARETVLGADAHQDLPFERLIEALELPRDLSRSPLFQVMLAFQNMPPAGGEQPGGALALLPFSFETQRAQFELHLSLTDLPRGLFGVMAYRTELFEAASVRRLVRQLESLLTGMARSPRHPVAHLPLLSAEEEQQIVREWNDTRVEYGGAGDGGCLHDLIEAQVARTPGAPAAAFAGREISYAELHARAGRLARRLQALGCGPETRVGVAMERSLELIVALLATLRAGSAYVPLDPDYPADRLAYMIADARPAVLLTQERLLAGLPASDTPTVCVDAEWEALGSGPELAGDLGDDRALAYVIYTSGSTGRPKGAMVHHRGIRNRLLWMQEAYGMSADDTVLQKTPFSFDVSVWELFWPLLAGARLVFAQPGGHRDSSYLADLIARERVTILHFVPSLLQVFLEEPDLSRCRSLRLVVASGEALPPDLVRRFFERLPWARLENLYGPTEASVDVTSWTCSPGGQRTVPIGRPIANTRIHLLDRAGQPVPIGIAGELAIGGVNVGRGYLGRPDLTADRFVPDPFAADRGEAPGARLYRTGDLARHLADGAIEYLGRIDHQVKVRGFRIELGEIENVLALHPAVREAAVTVREVGGSRQLVAYVVAAAAAAPAPDALRQHLRERLPEHMVPAHFVALDALPLSPNGKLERRALPAPVPVAAEAGYEPPATLAEESLAQIWAEVLELGRVGVRDNFFSLGGDSILSLRVLARARDLGLSLTLQQLFQHQTVRELARAAGTGASEPTVADAPFSLVSADDRERMPEDVEDAYPLTRLQAGMLFHSELDPETAIYHDISSTHLQAPFDEPALRGAFARTVARHPVLRTSFDLTTFGEPLQLVHREVPFEIEMEDLRALPDEEQEAVLAEWTDRERQRPFAWRRPPLLRIAVHRRGAESFQISLGFHHAILDGWSLATLLAELLQAYMALCRGEELPPGEPAGGAFRRFVALEQHALHSAESRRYWDAALAEAPAAALPRWRPRKAIRQGPGAHEADLPPQLATDLQRVAREAGLPLKSLLLAAHCRLLAALTGQMDVITGLVSNGRPEEAGGERALGLFLNTVPLRLVLGEGSWRDLADSVFAAERDLLPHRRYPIAELQHRAGGRPLFEAVFNYVHFHVTQSLADLDDVRALGNEYHEQTNFPLLASFSRNPFTGQLRLRLEYDSREFPAEQIAEIATGYVRTLEALAGAGPAERHDHFSLLSAEERARIVVGWNDTARPRPAATRVHDLFAAQAARTHEAVALEGDGLRLSYRELAERAGDLARTLAAQGAPTDSLVGVCLQRSPAMAVAVLGILQAGCAYVPLDPSYPAERLAVMAEDADLRLLVAGASTRDRLPASLAERGARILALDPAGRLEDPLGTTPATRLRDTANAGDAASLAYLLYTSGSTGRPKGVAMPHEALVNLIAWQANQSPEPRRTLQFAPLGFDVSFQEMFATWATGGTLVLVNEDVRRDPELLLGHLADRGVERLFLPFVALQQLAEAAVARGTFPAGLREVVTAGEQLQTTGAVAELFRRLPGCRLHNQYGPTEAHVVTALPLAGEPGTWPTLPPIGRPIANLRIYLLDGRHEPVPPGTPAELHIGGAGLARGYLGRPDLTAERFVPDPHGGEPGGRLYRTGDLARHLPDGTIDLLGRADQQVKVRGFRVEPGEIEAALASLPGVREAAVVVWGSGGAKRLAAYFTLQPGQAPAVSDLARALRERLPDYMVPGAFVRLDALPLTPSGKVDRRALPAPEAVDATGGPAFVAPRTAVEEKLAALFAEALEVQRVGVFDNFLELGGHSLLATRLMARLNQAFGTSLPLRRLFEAPTLAELAAAVEAARGGAGPAAAAELPSIPEVADRLAPVPLTDVQETFWLGRSGLFDLGGSAANVYVEYEAQGFVWQVAPDLDDALARVVARHEILRTIVLPDGTQRVLPEVPPFAARVEDLSGRPPEEVERALEAVREELRYACRPVDRWPLFDVVLHQLDDGLLRVHARFEAMLLDGPARGVLIGEILQILDDPARELPPIEISYLDVARALAGFQASEAWERSRAYWLERLPSLPPAPRLPLVRDLAPTDVPRIVKRQIEALPRGAWAGLQASAARRGLSPTGVLTAAFVEALRSRCADPGFTLGLGGTYRPPVHPGIEQVVGSFTALHLLAAEPSAGPFEERARRLQARMLEDLDHQHFSGYRVLRELNRLRRTGPRATLPVHFNSVVEHSRSTEEAGASGGLTGMTEVDLMISLPQVVLLVVALEDQEGGLSFITQAVEEVLAPGCIPGLLDDLRDLLVCLADGEAAWREEPAVPTAPVRTRPVAPPPALRAAPAAPETPLQTELAGLWEEILGQRPADLHDDFYALGGNSLLAVRLMDRIAARFGLDGPLPAFLEQPTLGRLAELVDTAREERARHLETAKSSESTRRSPLGRLGDSLAAFWDRLLPPPKSPAYGMRIYVLLWFSQFVSGIGTGLGSFALGVWVYRQNASTTQYAMMAFLATCTGLLVGPLAGVLADRWDRRRLILLGDSGAAMMTALMALALYTGQMRLWHVYIVVFFMVGFSLLQGPAFTATVSMLVPRRHLGRASGMAQAAGTVTGLVCPPLAGALVPVIDYHGVILIDILTFSFAFVVLLLIRLPRPPAVNPEARRRSIWSDFMFGWSYIRQRGGLLGLMSLFALTNFSVSMVQVLLTPLILSFGSASNLGVVSSAAAAGGLLGSLALSLWGGPRNRVRGILLFILLQSPILLLGALQPNVRLIALAAFLFMALSPFVGGLSQAIWQSKVPPEIQGRVFAMRGLVISSTAALAFLVAGPLADRVFEPLMAPGGALADTVGQLIGMGKGRGVGLLFMAMGLLIMIIVAVSSLNPRLRNVESELPDAVPDREDTPGGTEPEAPPRST